MLMETNEIDSEVDVNHAFKDFFVKDFCTKLGIILSWVLFFLVLLVGGGGTRVVILYFLL